MLSIHSNSSRTLFFVLFLSVVSITMVTKNNNKTSNRKRHRSDNPLSVARGKKKAESLWHRKSGAGYALFVEFYARHAEAVCCCPTSSSDSDNNGKDSSTAHHQTSSTNQQQQGGGMSRAAKRRKKKKGQSLTAAKPLIDEKNESTQTTLNQPASSQEAVMNSKLLAAFEKMNGRLCQNQAFRSFLVSLSNPLPLTFRLRRGLDVARLEQLRNDLAKFENLVSPTAFDDCIYQAKSSSLSKETLGKVSPDLKEFLVNETSQGTLARQELGSMLPVLGLSKGGWIKSGSRVLDMCASPGSKTLQALEVVGVTGRVKANDINESRLTSLREAVERSGVSHTNRIKYTMHDASKYPIPTRLFDAIICDVPCSGDGTIRKDAHILPAWTPNTSNALHALQLRILKRAIECVRIGGVVSYSTCSLNPVEDEAVVCAALRAFSTDQKSGPVVQLEDWPKGLSGFNARPGVECWHVAEYNAEADDSDDDDQPHLQWSANFADATKHGMPDACETMWPPEVVPPGLDKCVRLHPHDHDSGGFFVALFKRLR